MSTKAPPRLCLIDASGYIHRAYHALPLLTTSKGEPVNAIYGFSRMVSKLLKTDKPDYLAVCFDTPKPTFRHEMYVEYKGTRKETDAALISQMPAVEELAEGWGLPCVKADGFEADDVIATLAVQAKEKGWDVLILSGDKDVLQLVNDHVRVRDEIRKVEFDADKVHEKFGVRPNQLVDYFSLIGDKVDNVIGVPGVGEKTAAKIINEHGSIETMFKTMNGSKDALNVKLKEHRPSIERNTELVRLKTDVKLPLGLDDLKIKKADVDVLAPLLKRLEFRAELYGVDAASVDPAAVNKTRKVRVVLTEKDLSDLKSRLKDAWRVGYDLETDSLQHHKCGIVGVALSTQVEEAWYIPVAHSYIGVPAQLPWETIRAALKEIFESPKIQKVGQNIKFDDAILRRCGLTIDGPQFDTMIAMYCLDPSRSNYGLKTLAAEILGERMTQYGEVVSKKQTIAEVAIEQVSDYAGADAEVVLRLADLFDKQLKEQGLQNLFDVFEMPLVPVIRDMETAGIKLDVDYLQRLKVKFELKRKGFEREIYEIAGETFTINSPLQLSRILFEKLKLPPGKKNKTGYSTDESVISKLAAQYPICAKILEYREMAKLMSTYIDALLEVADPKTHRVHTSFHQAGTTTGRLSSSNPNLQNIPIRSDQGQEIRRAFIASPSCKLLSADYSQIDLRALAHISGDPVLVETFISGGDVHQMTAAQVYRIKPSEVTPEMRRRAKAINFGIVYGQQAWGLSQTLNIDVDEAQDFINKYFERYSGVKAWIEQTLVDVRKSGVTTTLAGRRRKVDGINSDNGAMRGFAERIAVNTPIQGTSADIIKLAMIAVQKTLHEKKLQTKMLLQVHDELLFDVPDSELKQASAVIKDGMESAMKLKVPLLVDMKVGANWNDMEKWAA